MSCWHFHCDEPEARCFRAALTKQSGRNRGDCGSCAANNGPASVTHRGNRPRRQDSAQRRMRDAQNCRAATCPQYRRGRSPQQPRGAARLSATSNATRFTPAPAVAWATACLRLWAWRSRVPIAGSLHCSATARQCTPYRDRGAPRPWAPRWPSSSSITGVTKPWTASPITFGIATPPATALGGLDFCALATGQRVPRSG